MGKVKGIVIGAIVLGISSAVWAEETAVVDASKDWSIRLTLGSAPKLDEAEAEGVTNSMDGDAGARFEMLAAKRFWSKNNPEIGGVLGAGLFFGGHDGTIDSGPEVELSTVGLLVQGGFLAKLGDVAILEIGPYLGVGSASNDTEGAIGEGRGAYAFFGVKGGLFFMLGDSVELGLEAGYEGFSHEQEYETLGGNVDVTYSGSGAHVAGVLTVKF